MIDSIKKNSLEFFNTHGLPSKKLENWKFTSSRNFKNFSDPLINSQNSVEFEADELSLVFINGILNQDSLKNFKFSHLLEVKSLNTLDSKNLLQCSDNFLNESMFNLGISEFKKGSYISFKKNSAAAQINNLHQHNLHLDYNLHHVHDNYYLFELQFLKHLQLF